MNRLLRSIAKYFLPVLFISYIGCISLFTHTHVVNGVTIVHSHPYNPKAHHDHTTTEFQLIHALSHLTTAEPSVGVRFRLCCLPFRAGCSIRLPASYAHSGSGRLTGCVLRPFRFCKIRGNRRFTPALGEWGMDES